MDVDKNKLSWAIRKIRISIAALFKSRDADEIILADHELRIAALEAKCAEFETRITSVENQCIDFENRITTIEAQCVDFEARISALENPP